MNPIDGMAQKAVSPSRRYRWLYMFEGAALVLLGITGIALPTMATLAFEIFFGWLLLLSGVLGAVTTAWNRRSAGFIWSIWSIWAVGLLLGVNLIFGGSALLAMAAQVQLSAARTTRGS